MTENEAIDFILKDHSSFTNPMSKAYVMACKALEEIQNYRALGTLEEIQTIFAECTEYEANGTIEEFKALKEKNEPKKPIDRIAYCDCPRCGEVDILGYPYCPICGQKLDWQ